MTSICVPKYKVLISVDLCGCYASWYVTEIACLAIIKPGDQFDRVRLPYRTDSRGTVYVTYCDINNF